VSGGCDHAVANTPSQAVMRRIGPKCVGEFNHPRIPASHPLCRHVLYATPAWR
jgi:hypothetical protein